MTESVNDDMRAGQVAADAAEVYERDFVPALFGAWPEPVLDSAQVGAGHCVVDVGCGTGVLARAAADRVGPHGSVIGVDPNDGMLTVAARVDDRVDWRPGPAESLPVADGVADAVVSQFVLMYVTDTRAAATEMARVLRPGGRLAVATWAGLDQNPGFSAMHALMVEQFGADLAEGLLAPFSIPTAEALAGALAPAFPDVEVVAHVRPAVFPSIEAFVHTEIRGWTFSSHVDDEMYARFLSEAERRWQHLTTARGVVRFPSPALIARARRKGRRPRAETTGAV